MDAKETMRKARSDTRRRRRYQVTLGAAVSFSIDVSPRGFCTEAMRVLVPGYCCSRMHRRRREEVAFTGHVAWNVAGDAMLGVRGQDGNLVWRSRPGIL